MTLAVLGATGAIPAAAHHPTVTEYQTGLTPNSGAWDGVDGDDGKLWFTEDALSAFGPLGAGDGLISEFTSVLTLAGNPKGMTLGPDGNLWIAESGAGGAIARVTKAGGVTEFNTGLTPSDPWDITSGPDGNLWFVSNSPAFIGRITPGGSITEFSASLTANSRPTAITAGPDDSLWFTESGNPGRIGRITTDGVITENSIGLTPNIVPTDITTVSPRPYKHAWPLPAVIRELASLRGTHLDPALVDAFLPLATDLHAECFGGDSAPGAAEASGAAAA